MNLRNLARRRTLALSRRPSSTSSFLAAQATRGCRRRLRHQRPPSARRRPTPRRSLTLRQVVQRRRPRHFPLDEAAHSHPSRRQWPPSPPRASAGRSSVIAKPRLSGCWATETTAAPTTGAERGSSRRESTVAAMTAVQASGAGRRSCEGMKGLSGCPYGVVRVRQPCCVADTGLYSVIISIVRTERSERGSRQPAWQVQSARCASWH
ncbi:hypothetical protein BJY59DRAFT_478464 [Rhodotorula toruloides]